MTSNIVLHKLTRRTFLKATAATAAVVAVGDKLFGGPMSTLVENAAAAPTVTEDKWIPGLCYMCFAYCGILAHRVNGVVVKIEGDPEDPKNLGKLCGRAHAGLMKLYNPWRFKNPMKRTNPEKGRDVDPKWEEITWEEALNTIGDKLAKIHAEDPKKLLVMGGWGQGRGGAPTMRVGQNGFKTPNWISGPGGITCAAAKHNIGYMTNGTSLTGTADWKYCNYHLVVGLGIGLNKADAQKARLFWEAKERGIKVVVVDTRLDKEGTKADEWVPIRGGTDLAFFLALANVMLYELNQYDVDFIKQRTNGPYLIRSDNGFYVRSSTEMLEEDSTRRNQVLGKPYIWDPADNKAKLFDDPTIQDYALEGTFTVEGVECSPGFALMKEQMRGYAPEWAENITTVTAATIRRIASELVEAARFGSTIMVDGVTFPYRPVSVDLGRGGETHKWATQAVMANYMLNLLLGSQMTPGGCNKSDAKQETGVDGVNKVMGTAVYRGFNYPPDYSLYWSYWPASYKSYFATFDAILNPEKYGIDYNLDMLLHSGANPIFGFGSGDVVTEAIKKIPFVAAISYHSDEPTELSDIVLADPGYTEWLRDIAGRGIHQPLVASPLYNTKLPEDIYEELAARSGWLADWNKYQSMRLKDQYKLDPNQKYTQAEILDRTLKNRWGAEYGLDWHKEHSPKRFPAKSEKHNYAYYRNPQTRYFLYFEYMKWAAEELKKDMAAAGATHPYPEWEQSYYPLPRSRTNPTYEAPPEFDLYENNFRTSLMSMGFSPDNPWTYEAMKFDRYPNSVWINRETAKKKGLKDGDLVWVESYAQEPWSKVKGEVLTSEGVHPEGCIIGGQWGRWAVGMNPIAKEGPHHNSLMTLSLEAVDHYSGSIEMGSKVKIYKV